MINECKISLDTPIDINDLADIRNVEIDPTLPVEEKKRSYHEQIKNPFIFRYEDTIIRSSFDSTGPTMGSILKQYLLSRQGLMF